MMEHASRLIERLGDVFRLKASPRAAARPASTPRPEPVDGRDRSHGLGLWWTFGAGFVLAAAVLVAIVQNSHRVGLHFLAWHVNVSLIVVVLTTALTAVALDEIGGLIWRRRRRSRLDRRRELQVLQARQAPTDDAPLAPEPPSVPAALGARGSEPTLT
jgi:uncharacterized integral membrane protein